MSFSHVTVVLQGPLQLVELNDPLRPTIHRVIASVRAHLPGCQIVVATWKSHDLPDLDVDLVLQLDDPGSLPTLKKHAQVPNNINRQIVSTRAGLARVTTSHALKMRTDSLLTGNAFVAIQREFPARDAAAALFTERVVVGNLYTINPRIFEEVPFHVSDWFQYGRTEDLRAWWDCPAMTEDEATYFSRHEHRPGTTELDQQFNARYAVEQYIFMNCVRRKFPVACEFLNDVRPEVLECHERIVANNLIIVEMTPAGFSFPKNNWATRSLFHHYNCYTHDDWLWLYRRRSGGEPLMPRFTRRISRRIMLGALAWIHNSGFGRACFRAGVLRKIAQLIGALGLRGPTARLE